MSKEKQIEEMVEVISKVPPIVYPFGDRRRGKHFYAIKHIAEHLYNAGYRKQQSEGEWREDVIAFCNVCSSCRAMVDRSAIKCNSGKLHYCPNCGAKMKGGETDE